MRRLEGAGHCTGLTTFTTIKDLVTDSLRFQRRWSNGMHTCQVLSMQLKMNADVHFTCGLEASTGRTREVDQGKEVQGRDCIGERPDDFKYER